MKETNFSREDFCFVILVGRVEETKFKTDLFSSGI